MGVARVRGVSGAPDPVAALPARLLSLCHEDAASAISRPFPCGSALILTDGRGALLANTEVACDAWSIALMGMLLAAPRRTWAL